MFYFANILQPLIDFFEAIMKFFHDQIGFTWGFSIVALTIIIRAALLPLTVKQFHSMQKMAKFQPDIKKLQARYKGDREKLQQETMRFYRENKINPLSSCLPILAQIPVMLALFFMLRSDLRTAICPGKNPAGTVDTMPCGDIPDAGFLFVPDLTDVATGGVLAALLILYVTSQLASGLLASTSADKNQRMLMVALPVVFVAFIWQFPAGLIVYWITTNLWTIVQQLIIRGLIGPIKPVEGEEKKGLLTRWGGARAATDSSTAATTGEAVPIDKAGREKVASSASKPKKRSGGPPPGSPRKKKKKRSGRRR